MVSLSNQHYLTISTILILSLRLIYRMNKRLDMTALVWEQQGLVRLK